MYVGELACDVAEHVASSRLCSVEALGFDGDEVFLRPWTNAFPYWLRPGAVSEATVALLQKDVTLSWVHVENDGRMNHARPHEQTFPYVILSLGLLWQLRETRRVLFGRIGSSSPFTSGNSRRLGPGAPISACVTSGCRAARRSCRDAHC
jgi:hypothetical protein